LDAANSLAKDVWFNQKVEWKFGTEGLPWKTTIENPDGSGAYLLILRPLWVLEGGVVALEIVIARPQEPDVNLLGTRENNREYPFVVTAKDLQKGLAHSRFGAVRTLRCNDIAADVKLQRFRLGKGVGSGSTYCAKCKNLQEISMWITIKSTKNREL